MPCCKAATYRWCEESSVVYVDKDGKEYCVFHAPQSEKDLSPEEFNNRIFEKIIEAKVNGEQCNLSGTIFEGDISFNEFNKDNSMPEINFSWAIFNGVVNFSEITFSKNVDFSAAIFNKVANYFKAHFNKGICFLGATFNEGVCFREAIFNEVADFSGVVFNNSADSLKGILKELPKIHIVVVDFENAIFNGMANFYGAYFGIKVDSSIAYFSGVTFNGEARFSEATFSGKAGLADFNSTIFKEFANFSGVTFSNAFFSEAIFNHEAYFTKAIFKLKADFSRSTFNKKMRFSKIIFKEVDFSWSKFRSGAEFFGETFEESANLIGININKKDRLRFEKVNLQKASFLDTDLRMIDFINCKWPEEKNRRCVLYDEIELFKNKEENKDFKEKIKKVETLNRRLKQKYKEEHDEQEVSNWHYGEKEMQRKGSTWKSFSFYLLHLYCIVNLIIDSYSFSWYPLSKGGVHEPKTISGPIERTRMSPIAKDSTVRQRQSS